MAKTANAKTKVYSRYGREIYVAAKSGGTDPSANLSLRRLIEKAKKDQVPAHVIERAVLLSEGERIKPADLRLPESEREFALDTLSLEQAERYLLRRALDRADGDAEAAARQLGLSRSAFYRRLAKHRT